MFEWWIKSLLEQFFIFFVLSALLSRFLALFGKTKTNLSRNWTKVAIFWSLCTPQKFHTSSFVLVASLSKRRVDWTWQQLYYFFSLLLHLHRVWSSWGFRSRDRGGSDGRRRRSFARSAWGSRREVKSWGDSDWATWSHCLASMDTRLVEVKLKGHISISEQKKVKMEFLNFPQIL